MVSIFVASPSFSRSQILRTELLAVTPRVTFQESSSILTKPELIALLTKLNPEILVVGAEKIDTDVLQAASNLKLIEKYGVGTDNIDFDAVAKSKIKLNLHPGTNRNEVAEFALAQMIGVSRNIFSSIEKMRSGIWDKFGGVSLSELKIGIVGLGNVGASLLKLLKPFGCEIRYFDIERKTSLEKETGVGFSTYEELLSWADVVSLHVPKTPLTHEMFSAKQIAKVKPNFILVNTARGDVVDFEKILEALKTNKMAAYVTDVFHSEPFDGSSLGEIPGLFLTPHIAGNSNAAVLKAGREIVASIRNGQWTKA